MSERSLAIRYACRKQESLFPGDLAKPPQMHSTVFAMGCSKTWETSQQTNRLTWGGGGGAAMVRVCSTEGSSKAGRVGNGNGWPGGVEGHLFSVRSAAWSQETWMWALGPDLNAISAPPRTARAGWCGVVHDV